MFELNPMMDITAIVDIGPDNRSAMVIDNLYENPEEVRQLALKIPRQKDIPLTNHRDGVRGAWQTEELRRHTEKLWEELLGDEDHWGRPTHMGQLSQNMSLMWFITDYLDEKVIDEDPLALVPFQTWYTHNPSPFQFTIEVFLNPDKECFGGTNVWNFAGKTSVVEDLKNMYADQDREWKKFDIRKDIYNTKFTWTREMTFGMKFNRAVVLPADLLQAPIMQTAHYTDTTRITQKIFL
tara:strand:+ start:14609 stop:15322 length:714 start_codon:yes stop_codon:yes gene_type:complete